MSKFSKPSEKASRFRAMPLQSSFVGLIAKNFRELRKMGLTSADLLALQQLAILCRNGSGIVRVSSLGRLLGISRSGAHYRLARLERLGVVVRVGRAVILNVKSLLRMAARAVVARAAHAKELFSWQKKAKRSKPQTDTRQIDKRGLEKGDLFDLSVSEVLTDGRKIIGQRLFGSILVPVYG